MTGEIVDGELLFDHFEQFLGEMDTSWSIQERESETESFSVFEYAAKPDIDCKFLVTFGISRHLLDDPISGTGVTRLEFGICVNSKFESKPLGALLHIVGRATLRRHATPGLHGVLPGAGPVLWKGNPVFEHFYLTNPGYFPLGFDKCDAVTAPILIVQLIPISSNERDFILLEGWQAFENAIVHQEIDLLDFDTRKEVIWQGRSLHS